MRPYDALVIVSFGGPEGPDDVMPFLENVTAGRGVPRERLLEVAEHYHHVGGVSPINGQNRELLAAVRADFAVSGVDLPVYWGNRHWSPTLPDVVAQLRDDGVAHAIAFLTSAYASFSGCRQYLDALERARLEVGEGAPTIDRVRQYFNHPGFIEPMVDGVVAAVQQLPEELRDDAALAFVAHSIPTAMDAASGPAGHAYVTQLNEAVRLVAQGVDAADAGRAREVGPRSVGNARGVGPRDVGNARGVGPRDVGNARGVGPRDVTLSFCSRSGSPSTPWLEPDIGDRLAELAAAGRRAVVVVPIGFVSDHMEVVYDLDTEAAQRAHDLGLAFVRSPTVGTQPRFVAMVRELVLERAAQLPPRALGAMGPAHDVCPVDCCRMAAR